MNKPSMPWSMARVASRRQLPKPRKMHGPVGEKRYSWGERLEDSWIPTGRPTLRYSMPECGDEATNERGVPQIAVTACHSCGYHVCSCEPVDPYASTASFDTISLQDEIDKLMARSLEKARMSIWDAVEFYR